MATIITSECINCGACEPECPNTAIYQGGAEWERNGQMHPALAQDIFYIVPEKCTECVGFFDHEACAAVCPVDCCVPDPQNPETEAVLIARAQQLHPEKEFPADVPSRFKKGNGHAAEAAAAPAPTLTPPPASAPAPAVAAPPAPVAAAAAPPVAAPAAKPAAAPAAKAAAAPAAARVEKAVAAPKAPAAPAAPKGPRPVKAFAGELAVTFEDAAAMLETARPGGASRLKWLAALGQPLLGALPFSQKRRIEQAVADRRFFTASGATGLNILHNMIIYPAVLTGFGALVLKRDVFTTQVTSLIVLGFVMAGIEAIVRLREAVLHAVPLDEVVYRGALYSPPLAVLFAPLTRVLQAPEQTGTVAVDGFHGGEFEDKQERERRYGEVYSLRQRGNGYLLRFEFPRRVPHSALKDELGVPDEMPDYDYELGLQDGYLVVKGRVEDPTLRKLAAVSPAFPPNFATQIKLPGRVAGFKHRFVDKTLEVVLVTQ